MEDWVQPASRGELPRREVMQTPDEVAAMLRLKALGWGVRRIAGELGCSHMTVRRYLAEGGWVAYRGHSFARETGVSNPHSSAGESVPSASLLGRHTSRGMVTIISMK